MRSFLIRLACALALCAGGWAGAQLPAPIQTPVAALLQDAGEYAARYGVDVIEAQRRLDAQARSVAYTDQLRVRFADRLAGIAIEHVPAYRIVVLLTGDAPVADEAVPANGSSVPVVFRTGARATHDQLVAALTLHQMEIRAALPYPPAMGVDPRTGALVVLIRRSELADYPPDLLAARFTTLTGVPVRVESLGQDDVEASAGGGSRVTGVNPADGKRYVCTSGFVVTDGMQTGVVTAAHCPDDLTIHEPGGTGQPLTFVGQWGWGYRDVQVHVGAGALRPLFYADTARSLMRRVTGARPRASTRAGDFVCHRGERTGYSCAVVELTDFAPSGELCGGACTPSWVTVAGPGCRGGDSGGPVFAGTTAFGILKGSSYRPDGSCGFYYYMSLDFLPDGWRLLTAPDVAPPAPPAP